MQPDRKMTRGARMGVAVIALGFAGAWAPALAPATINIGKGKVVYARMATIGCLASEVERPNNVFARQFKASGRAGGWRLTLQINRFNGYHRYEIWYGLHPLTSDAHVFVYPPGGGVYSNHYVNPLIADRLTVGGAAAFTRPRGLDHPYNLGINYGIMYDSTSSTPKFISLTGLGATCVPASRP